MIATPVIHDGTRPGEEHTLGPGRLNHAYPDGSLVALCGQRRTPNAQPAQAGPKCRVCITESQRKQWVQR